jgi:type II secretory pathway predicted ATPase ExeA
MNAEPEGTLLDFFSLREHPFGNTPSPRFLFQSETHCCAYDKLIGGIERGEGFQALIAKAGMGKTTLIARLLDHYRNSASTAFIFQTQCNSRELLQYLLWDLDIEQRPEDTIVTRHARFQRFLLSEKRRQRRVIIVVDEAQNLDSNVLETVRLLSNFETLEGKLLHIILAGQGQLMKRLLAPELIQLRQRISGFHGLETLSLNNIGSYIQHRLKIAGHTGCELFTFNAIGVIAAHSAGIPRDINNICSAALVRAHEAGQRTIGGCIIREAVDELCMNVPAMPNDTPGFLLPVETEDRNVDARQITLQSIVHQFQVATGASGAAIALGNKETMICRARSGTSAPSLGALINLESGLSGEAARSTNVVVCNDIEKDPRSDAVLCRALGIRSLVIIPLVDSDNLCGIVGIFSDRQDAFKQPELAALGRAVESCTENFRNSFYSRSVIPSNW